MLDIAVDATIHRFTPRISKSDRDQELQITANVKQTLTVADSQGFLQQTGLAELSPMLWDENGLPWLSVIKHCPLDMKIHNVRFDWYFAGEDAIEIRGTGDLMGIKLIPMQHRLLLVECVAQEVFPVHFDSLAGMMSEDKVRLRMVENQAELRAVS